MINLFSDNVLIAFIGALVADILYMSGLLAKINGKISLIEQKINHLDNKLKRDEDAENRAFQDKIKVQKV